MTFGHAVLYYMEILTFNLRGASRKMRKASFLLLLAVLGFAGFAHAEDMAATTEDAKTSDITTNAATPEAVSAVAADAAATAEAVATDVTTTTVPQAAEEAAKTAEAADNLEFVSGEVSATNEAAKSVTVKLYGETDNEPTEKTLTVTIDESTDITDGETDKDIKALAAGTEVDVEYDPKTNKATYIFVY